MKCKIDWPEAAGETAVVVIKLIGDDNGNPISDIKYQCAISLIHASKELVQESIEQLRNVYLQDMQPEENLSTKLNSLTGFFGNEIEV